MGIIAIVDCYFQVSAGEPDALDRSFPQFQTILPTAIQMGLAAYVAASRRTRAKLIKKALLPTNPCGSPHSIRAPSSPCRNMFMRASERVPELTSWP